MAGDTCDTCSRGPVIGVASSALGPISFAYCAECAANGAEPLWLLKATLEDVGGPDGLADWVKNVVTWKDDKYLPYPEWLEV